MASTPEQPASAVTPTAASTEQNVGRLAACIGGGGLVTGLPAAVMAGFEAAQDRWPAAAALGFAALNLLTVSGGTFLVAREQHKLSRQLQA